MFAKVFGIPFLGAVYASGWWAWVMFDGNVKILQLLIGSGIIYLLVCIAAAILDALDN